MRNTDVAVALASLMIMANPSVEASLCKRDKVRSWTNPKDIEKNICGFESHLRSWSRGEKIQDMGEKTLGILTSYLTKGKYKLPKLPRGNAHKAHLQKSLKHLFEQAETDISTVTGSSPRELLVKSLILEKLQEVIQTEDLPNDLKLLGIHLYGDALKDFVVTNEQGQYQFNKELLGRIGASAFRLDTVEDDLKDQRDEVIKLKKQYESLNKKLVDQGILLAKEITKIRADLSALEKEKKQLEDRLYAGEDVRDELQVVTDKIKMGKSALIAKADVSKQELQELGYALTIGTTLFSFSNPELAQKIQTVGQASLNMATALVDISSQALNPATASLGPYAMLTVSAFKVFSALQGANSPNVYQMLFEQLQQISQQVVELRQEMHDRFDQVEEILGTIYANIMKGFELLAQDLNNINFRLNQISIQLNQMKKEVRSLDKKLEDFKVQDLQFSYLENKENCLKYGTFFTGPMPPTQFNECVQSLNNFSSIWSTHTALTGSSVALDDFNLAKELAGEDFDYNIGLLAKKFDYYAPEEVPNPVAWSYGDQDLKDFIRMFPENADQLQSTVLDSTKARGEYLEDFITFLQSDGSLANQLVQSYSKQYSRLLFQLENKQNELYDTFKVQNRRRLDEQIQTLRSQISYVEGLKHTFAGGYSERRHQELKNIVNLIKKDIEFLETQKSMSVSMEDFDPYEMIFNASYLVKPCAGKADYFSMKLPISLPLLSPIVNPSYLYLWNIGKADLNVCYKVSNAGDIVHGDEERSRLKPFSVMTFGLEARVKVDGDEKEKLIFDQSVNIRTIEAISSYNPNWSHHPRDHEGELTNYRAHIYAAWHGAPVFYSSGGGSDVIFLKSYLDQLISNSTRHPMDRNERKRVLEIGYQHFVTQKDQAKKDLINYMGEAEFELGLTTLDARARITRGYIYYAMNKSYHDDLNFRLKVQGEDGFLLSAEQFKGEMANKVLEASMIDFNELSDEVRDQEYYFTSEVLKRLKRKEDFL